MSKVELPLDTQCFLCDSLYGNAHLTFVIYKCFLCSKFTAYCFSCEMKLQKLFGKGNLFKCIHCNKLTNALDKIEIRPPNNNINNNSFYKTPTKPFMENNIPISSIRQNNNFFMNLNQTEEERKDNNINKIAVSNILNDFNKIGINLINQRNNNNANANNSPFVNNNTNNYLNNTIAMNNNRNVNISNITKEANRTLNNSNSISDFKKINNYSLLTSRNRLNKRYCLNESLLGRKREDSENNNKINMLNPSKGKFKNLISMKMSKVYQNKNGNNKNCDISDNINLNNSQEFNLLCDKNRRTDKVRYNPFLTNQSGMNFNFIDGKSTPHRLTNDSFEYF